MKFSMLKGASQRRKIGKETWGKNDFRRNAPITQQMSCDHHHKKYSSIVTSWRFASLILAVISMQQRLFFSKH